MPDHMAPSQVPVWHARKIWICVLACRTAATGVVSVEPGISKDRFSTQTWNVTVSSTSIAAELHAPSLHTAIDGASEALHMLSLHEQRPTASTSSARRYMSRRATNIVVSPLSR